LKPTALHFAVAPSSKTCVSHFRVGLSQSSAKPALALAIHDENGADIARARSKYSGLEPVTVAASGTGDDGRAGEHSAH
jgi:hypothetical protein